MDSSHGAPPQGMAMVERKSAVPIYAFGLVWVIYAAVAPLYSPGHFITAGVLSLAAFLAVNKLVPPKIEYVTAKIEQDTGNPEADGLLREGGAILARIGESRARIKNSETEGKVKRIEQTLARIFAFVASSPECAPQLRKFMNYYLPTLQKLVESYVTFESQGIEGENISSSMRRIEGILDTMESAMQRQLDALFGDTALDISTDITVLEGMLAQEGLDGQQGFKLE